MAEIYDFKTSAVKKIFLPDESPDDFNDYTHQLSVLIESHSAMTEMYNKLKEKTNTEQQRLIEQNEQLKSENHALKLKVIHFEGVLKKCIPTHIIMFLIANAIIMTFSTIFSILYYLENFYIMDIYYLLCTIIISTTLFCTALRALVDWRNMLNGK